MGIRFNEEVPMRKSAKSKYRLSIESKIRLPTVDEALNIGYAFHTSNDPSLEGKTTKALACKITSDFLALTGKNDAERAYIDGIRPIVLSHGRGLTKRKEQYLSDLDRANKERMIREAQIRGAKWSSGGFAVAWKFLGPFIMAILGALIAQVFQPIVPAKVTNQTGELWPTILVGAIFVWAGRVANGWWADYKRGKIRAAFDTQCYMSLVSYEQGKMNEYKLYRHQLCEAWTQYTGAKYPRTPSYSLVMEGDLETRNKFELDVQENNLNEFVTGHASCTIVQIPQEESTRTRTCTSSIEISKGAPTARPFCFLNNVQLSIGVSVRADGLVPDLRP
jgi:hypothetical protein